MAAPPPLWTASELAQVTGGRWLVKPPPDFSPKKVTYDTSSGRLPGHACVMMTPVSWGRSRQETIDRLPKLARNKAACAIIQREQKAALPKLPPDFPLLLVDSTHKALRELARAARRRFRGKVLAVTGTVGKTTTREMLRHILSKQGETTATAGNNNNITGVWRAFCCAPREGAYCAVEMGFGLPLDGLRTSSIAARPHVAIVTTIANAHLDIFPDEMLKSRTPLQLLADHKALIFEALESGGAAVLGRDNPEFERVAAHARKKTDRVYSFGESADCDARIIGMQLSGAGTDVEAEVAGRATAFRVNLPGRHMAINALGALTAAWAVGADLEQAAADMASYEGAIGRAKVFDIPIAAGGRGKLIDDSFNATIASVRSSLQVLALFEPERAGRRVAVLGDVMHVGRDELEQHRGLAEAVAASGVDLVFTNGTLMKHLWEALPSDRRASHTATMPDLYRDLREQLRDGDVVAIKSGRGTGGLGDRAFLRLGDCLRDGVDVWSD